MKLWQIGNYPFKRISTTVGSSEQWPVNTTNLDRKFDDFYHVDYYIYIIDYAGNQENKKVMNKFPV